jgi:hypothetical protein
LGNSTIENLRSDLAADIVAQLTTDAVTGVTVREFPPGDEATSTDLVFIGSITATQDHLVFGGAREEALSAELFVHVLTPGAGDTPAATSEDRAMTILASIEDALRGDDTVSASVFHAQISEVESENFVTDDGRFCQLRVTVDAESHI